MPLLVPDLDDRRYRELLDEALARIPVHNPEWTNFNESDPGVTLLQLFAFMGESLLYRANQVPERHRRKFLQLLGIPLRPASSARGVVTVRNERGPLETVTLDRGVPVLAGKVGFVTENGLDVLPIEGQVFYRRKLSGSEAAAAQQTYDQLFGAFANESTTPEFYETVPLDAPTAPTAIKSINLRTDTVDASLWIALLARPGEHELLEAVRAALGGRTLTLGLMPFLGEQRRVLPAGGAAQADSAPQLRFEVSTGSYTGDLPRYEPIVPVLDRANPFDELTLVQLTLPRAEQLNVWDDLEPIEDGVGDYPPALDNDALRKRVVAWLRMRLPAEPATAVTADGTTEQAAPEATQAAWNATFSWAGINAARVAQRVRVSAELVGTGNGAPEQRLTLSNTPVLPDSVQLTVDGEGWTLIDDLLAAAPEIDIRDPSVPVGEWVGPPGDPRRYTVERESGSIAFGDGLRGKRPPAESRIIASYAYGGGAAGNVGIGAINASPLLPAGFKVSNPLPSWGGSDGQSAADAERTIPRFLKHRNRAVSREDFQDIVWATPGVALGRVDVLPLFHPQAGYPAPGVVTLLLVPDDPSNPRAPVPDRLFLEAVCAHLEPKRLLTTEIHLTGPEYTSLSVSIGFDVVGGREVAPVREAIKREIRQFLSPLHGGHEEKGWPLESAVEDRELWARAARVPGVARIRAVKLWDASGALRTNIELQGLQLPRLERIAADIGDAEDFTLPPGGPTPKRRLPVPVLPPTC